MVPQKKSLVEPKKLDGRVTCLPRDNHDEIIPEIPNFEAFAQNVLGWDPGDLVAIPQEGTLPGELTSLEIALPEYQETLRPTHVVREFEPKDPKRLWLMLVQSLPSGIDLDEMAVQDNRHWHASPHARFERLLRETEMPIGLLFNGTHLRLIYAPRGETSGYMTFAVSEMAQVAGRPIFAALHMLLSAERLFSLGENQRL